MSEMDQRSAEERACELGQRIKAAVEDGSFKLGCGYLREVFGGCVGCVADRPRFQPDVIPTRRRRRSGRRTPTPE